MSKKHIPCIHPYFVGFENQRPSLQRKTAPHQPLLGAKIKEGDILHFGFQTAVISKDVHPLGKLTLDDIVLHSYHRLATEARLSQLPYRNLPFEVRRWPSR